jgi:hypothetical protein
MLQLLVKKKKKLANGRTESKNVDFFVVSLLVVLWGHKSGRPDHSGLLPLLRVLPPREPKVTDTQLAFGAVDEDLKKFDLKWSEMSADERHEGRRSWLSKAGTAETARTGTEQLCARVNNFEV